MTTAMIPRTQRACGWCTVDISDMRGAAQYCSTIHKKAAAAKRHRERNPEYYKNLYRTPERQAWFKAYQERRGSEIQAYGKEYYRKDPEAHRAASRQWFADNPIKHRAYQMNRRSRKLNNPGSLSVSPREIARILRSGRCFYCLAWTRQLDADHVIPLIRGGRHAIGNLVAACKSCNSTKRSAFIVELKRGGVTFPWTSIRLEDSLPLSIVTGL